MQDKNKIKVKMFEAFKLAEDIIEILKESGIKSDYMDIMKYNVNPYYDQTDIDGPLVVENYYSVPDKIHTPLGYISITGSYTSFENGAINKMKSLLLEKLNLKIVKEATTTIFGNISGERYTINGEEPNYTNNMDYDDAKTLFTECKREYINSKK